MIPGVAHHAGRDADGEPPDGRQQSDVRSDLTQPGEQAVQGLGVHRHVREVGLGRDAGGAAHPSRQRGPRVRCAERRRDGACGRGIRRLGRRVRGVGGWAVRGRFIPYLSSGPGDVARRPRRRSRRRDCHRTRCSGQGSGSMHPVHRSSRGRSPVVGGLPRSRRISAAFSSDACRSTVSATSSSSSLSVSRKAFQLVAIRS